MPERAESRGTFGYLFALPGLALLVYLVVHIGPKVLFENAKLIGSGLGLVIALGGISHLVKTSAWRLTLSGEAQKVSFAKMLGLRLVSEAIGQLGFAGMVAGEATRAALLGSEVPLESRILSVSVDRGLFIACGAIVTVCGITLGLLILPLSTALRVYAALSATLLLAVVALAALAMTKRWPLLSRPARAFGRVPGLGKWLQSKEATVRSVEEKLVEFHRQRPAAFWGNVGLNFVCHALAVLEVYFIVLFLRQRFSLTGALVLESLTKVINLLGSLNPGNVGTYEGGTMLLAGRFGLSAMTGLTLSLCRRARGLFWALAGVLWFVLSRSAGRQKAAGGSESPLQKNDVRISESQGRKQTEPSLERTAAIILVDEFRDARGFTPELARVGALPVILRAILVAKSLRANPIVVAASRAAVRVIRRELLRTGRLPKDVQWFELDAEHAALPLLLGQLAAQSERILLLAGNTAAHPCLYELVREWDGRGNAVTLTTGAQFVGISAVSSQAAFDIARSCEEHIGSLIDLYAWFKPTHSVVLKTVDHNLWHMVDAPADRLIAEHKLDTWLVKPTDGLFARMNRRVSIPISRTIARFPITPNMVTVFTLGVSFLSGVFFGFGGYWNTVIGGLLSVWASILDGCDGELARLKLQASKFGCWLETVCDYLYYLFIFAGMSLGLSRSRGTDAYLIWGGFLLLGAIASFLVVGFARHYFASSHPEQFLNVWQRKAERQKSNPLMYLARNTEFIIRRCFLPYALLAFAVLNLTRFAFIASAVGANLVWIIALYSYWRVARPPHTAPAFSLRTHLARGKARTILAAR
jgi:phosphatidylglycerophosphate synthase